MKCEQRASKQEKTTQHSMWKKNREREKTGEKCAKSVSIAMHIFEGLQLLFLLLLLLLLNVDKTQKLRKNKKTVFVQKQSKYKSSKKDIQHFPCIEPERIIKWSEQ